MDTAAPVQIKKPVLSVDVSIIKQDTFQIPNEIDEHQLYSLNVFNNMNVPICIPIISLVSTLFEKETYFLDLFTGCDVDTISYFSLEHCRDCDLGNLPLPLRPIIINPNTYFLINFAIPSKKVMQSKYFHLHYAEINVSYADIIGKYKSDPHYWSNSLTFKCKTNKLPE